MNSTPTSPFAATPLDPYIIAEIGVNHEGSMARAKEMIASVAEAGGHAAKFQTYRADTLASREHSRAYWDTDKEPTLSQHQLFSKYDAFGVEEYQDLAEYCASVGLHFMSTPFDLEAVEFLAPLVPALKIASADITNIPLLRAVARSGRPVIMSVGAANTQEIETGLSVVEDAGASNVALLHCILNYPTEPHNANIAGVSRLIREFSGRVTVGYSDHVAPTEAGDMPAVELAVAFGATIVEKHFTDNRQAAGNDHYHAMDEAGLRRLVSRLTEMRELAGTGEIDLEVQGSAIQHARRRIFVARDVPAGAVLVHDDLIPLRAEIGVESARWDDVVGARTVRSMRAGAPVLAEDLAT